MCIHQRTMPRGTPHPILSTSSAPSTPSLSATMHSGSTSTIPPAFPSDEAVSVALHTVGLCVASHINAPVSLAFSQQRAIERETRRLQRQISTLITTFKRDWAPRCDALNVALRELGDVECALEWVEEAIDDISSPSPDTPLNQQS